MRRRELLSLISVGTGVGVVALFIGCDAGADAEPGDPDPIDAAPGGTGDGPTTDAAVATPDACVSPVVTMHDTYAQALYYDGTLGPLTGVIEVDQVTAGATITLEFWHGHGGQLHRFTLEPTHFVALKRGERITVGTSMVEGHAHTLFIDPVDETYRVPGAPDVPVPLGC